MAACCSIPLMFRKREGQPPERSASRNGRHIAAATAAYRSSVSDGIQRTERAGTSTNFQDRNAAASDRQSRASAVEVAKEPVDIKCAKLNSGQCHRYQE